MSTLDLLEHLKQRGFVKQVIDEDGLNAHLNQGSISFYVGFDPTGDSLHIGHLLPLMCMAWMQRAGHRPIVVLGGGTAMVGDPSGKDKTREILSPEKIQSNLEAMHPQFARFLDLEKGALLNNADWLCSLNYVQFLREIGQHFSVNSMIKAEGARQRLERGQGYSFIEFNYHLLQSYDFLHLHKTQNCTLQFGGDDQWFHFCGGSDLIRRECQATAYAFTIPLLATADGKKMGKTEKGAVWLDAEKVSPFEYYQYWVNVQDADVIRLMKLYTFMSLEEIAEYEKLQGADLRKAKHRLALEATTLAHGEEAAQQAQKSALALFTGGATDQMPTHATSFPCSIVDLLAESGLCKSKGDARRQIKGKAIKLDQGEGKVPVSNADLEIHEPCVIWFGKKKCIRLVEA